jgi:hypothetical protein
LDYNINSAVCVSTKFEKSILKYLRFHGPGTINIALTIENFDQSVELEIFLDYNETDQYFTKEFEKKNLPNRIDTPTLLRR